MTRGIISISIAYLLGSFLPAYWLGRFLPGIDIREHGTHNAGATNVFLVLGLYPAMLTALYDGLKGVIAMGIAQIFGASLFFIYLSGISAIVGHIFPFYLGFRGGRGAATSVGLLLLYLKILIQSNWLPVSLLLSLSGYTLVSYIIFRKGRILGFLVPPVLYFTIILVSRSIYIDIFSGLVVVHLVIINLHDTFCNSTLN